MPVLKKPAFGPVRKVLTSWTVALFLTLPAIAGGEKVNSARPIDGNGVGLDLLSARKDFPEAAALQGAVEAKFRKMSILHSALVSPLPSTGDVSVIAIVMEDAKPVLKMMTAKASGKTAAELSEPLSSFDLGEFEFSVDILEDRSLLVLSAKRPSPDKDQTEKEIRFRLTFPVGTGQDGCTPQLGTDTPAFLCRNEVENGVYGGWGCRMMKMNAENKPVQCRASTGKGYWTHGPVTGALKRGQVSHGCTRMRASDSKVLAFATKYGKLDHVPLKIWSEEKGCEAANGLGENPYGCPRSARKP